MPLDNKAIDALWNKLRELRYDQFICNWKMDLHQRDKLPKLDTYKIIKSDYRIEPHILYVRNKRYQRALTRLRVSSHKLNIEVGRDSRPYSPRHQRFCLYCDTGEIDDEIHFLLKCPFHSAGRFSLLQEIVHYLPLQSEPDHRDMFINIMTSKNQMILNALGKFVYPVLCFYDSQVCKDFFCLSIKDFNWIEVISLFATCFLNDVNFSPLPCLRVHWRWRSDWKLDHQNQRDCRKCSSWSSAYWAMN